MPSPTWITEPVSLTSTCLSKPLIFSLMIELISSAFICIATPYLLRIVRARAVWACMPDLHILLVWSVASLTRQQRLHGVQTPADSAIHDQTANMDLQAGEVGRIGLEGDIDLSLQCFAQACLDAILFGCGQGPW